MEDFARQCIHDHRNPVIKLNSCLKLFFAAKTPEEEQVVNKQYIQLRRILDHKRVEKRSNRAKAVWLANENLAQVTKVTKNILKCFGSQNKNGIFLLPEEMVILIETNRLELISVSNQVSIEKAYQILLATANLKRYRVYKTLVLLGYKLSKVKPLSSTNKRTLENDTTNHKRRKLQPTFCDKNCSNMEINSEIQQAEPSAAQFVENILNGARQIMPRDSTVSKISALKPDYYVSAPFKTIKAASEISLFICEEDALDLSSCSSKNSSNVYAICAEDVAFYSFNHVYLPFI